MIEEPILNGDGEPVGTKLRANPVLEPMRHLDEQLGHTVDQLRLTPRSRGQEAKALELAAAFWAQRDVALRALDRPRRSLPTPKSFER